MSASTAAETPEAESTQVSSRCSPDISSPGRRGTVGRIQTVPGPCRVTAPSIQRHSMESM